MDPESFVSAFQGMPGYVGDFCQLVLRISRVVPDSNLKVLCSASQNRSFHVLEPLRILRNDQTDPMSDVRSKWR